jgi:hypothetical protein
MVSNLVDWYLSKGKTPQTKGENMKDTQIESQFGIKPHAQLQFINGRNFDFQPEHLFCEECWTNVDGAFAMASYYGSCISRKDDIHSITVTMIPKGK